jgi:hypothetical protein
VLETPAEAVTGQVAERRIARYRLRDAAGRLLPKERVAGCAKWRVPGKVDIPVMHSPEVGRAHFKNLMVCGCLRNCPVCAAKISERRRVELSDALDRHPELTPVSVTVTLQHDRGDRLDDLVEVLKDGFRRTRSGAPWGRIRDAFGLVGSVTGLEITHGLEHGWHPHQHTMMLSDLPADQIDAEDLRERLTARFGAMLARRGRYVSPIYGIDVRVGDEAAADYLTKGHRWGPAHEVAKASTKKARSGRSPWELLEAYNDGDRQAGALFREYDAALKGRRQLTYSRGLRDRLGIGAELGDQELAEQEREPATVLVTLSWSEFKELLRQGRRAQLLAVADSGRADLVVAYLVALGIRAPEVHDPEVELVGAGVG